ncbi:hypothetical protein FACS189487_02760 [Campylobacterota bacterium]|nr:hypothetical protein FACS189487_02760 [Campylobacterota bacterium]
MTLLSLRCERAEALEKFIAENSLSAAENLLVTLFCADREKLRFFGALTHKLLPNALSIGIASPETAAVEPADFAQIEFVRFERTRLIRFESSELNAKTTARAVEVLSEAQAKNALFFSAHPACDITPFVKQISPLLDCAVFAYSSAASLIFNGTLLHSGIVAAIFENADFEFLIRRGDSYMPFGKVMEITKIEEGRIVELDRKPIDTAFCDPAPEGMFMILDAAGVKPIADISGKITAAEDRVRIDRGSEVRLGILTEQHDVCACNCDLVRKSAIWQFAPAPIEQTARSQAVGLSLFILRDRMVDATENVSLGLTEIAAAASRNAIDCAHKMAQRDQAVMRLIAKLNDDAEELMRQNKHDSSHTSASYDRLTNLPGRTSFLEHVAKTSNAAVALIDVERLRDINTFYGFEICDRLLVEFSALVGELINEDMRLFRTGGDSFVIFADGYDREAFMPVIERVLRVVPNAVFFEDSLAALRIQITIGAAFGSRQILSRADNALRTAKKKHQHLSIADEDSDQKDRVNMQMLEIIRQATIQPWWVLPYFQPIMRAHDQKVVKYEALIRLRGANGAIHQPASFLDIAKRSRYYSALTRIMVANTLEIFAGREEAVAINISAEDLQCVETMDYLAEKIASYSDPSKITIEVTESEMIDDYNAAIASIGGIKKYGAKIAIDDFGSGYSNFAYLIKFQADYLKIDGSIVSMIDKDEKSYQTLAAIVEFAKRLNLKTIAEFVSCEAILKLALEAGIDYFQGYYIGKPEPL